jgi:hypothetical protein
MTNKELSYAGEIGHFPEEVVEWMLQQQQIQGNKRDVGVFEFFKCSSRDWGGFDWQNTSLGRNTCRGIIYEGNFRLFFEKFPRQQKPAKLSFKTDEDAWASCHKNDKWVFNKYEVAQRFLAPYGFDSGLREEPIKKTGNYISRPIYNLSGMSLGVESFMAFKGDNVEHKVPLGHFWVESLFTILCAPFDCDNLISIDYHLDANSVLQTNTVKGSLKNDSFICWGRPVEGEESQPTSLLIHHITDLCERYEYVNAEFVSCLVGGKKYLFPIEIHLRPNPDLKHFVESESIRPIWIDEDETFVSDYAKSNGKSRIGFAVKNRQIKH